MKLQYSYSCKECGEKIITHNGLVEHIKQYHGFKHKDYYDKYIRKPDEGICPICGNETTFYDMKKGYAKFCSKKCLYKKHLLIDKDYHIEQKCVICDFTISGRNSCALAKKFKKHLKTHNTDLKEYYDTYLKKPGEGLCKYCGKPTTYEGFFFGYLVSCSGPCAAKAVRVSEMNDERDFREKQKEIKLAKEEEYKNLIQELKDRVHQFDWDGERNTWAGGPIASSLNENNPDNLITNNNITYIDGQDFYNQSQTITNDIDDSNYDAVFWL